jgi:hypothetical protein
LAVNQSQRATSQIKFITLFSAGYYCWALLCLVPAPEANCAKMQAQNHFAEPKGHVLTFNFFFVEFESAGS